MLMKIAFVNQKGGVAKTTSCHNIGAALARAGKKVLLVDLDPQGNLTWNAGVRDPEVTISDILHGDAKVAQTILHLKNYDLIPSDPGTSTIGAEAPDLLRKALKRLQYDYILIDCSPSLGPLTVQALIAADMVIIPVTPQFLPVVGVTQILDEIKKVHDRANHSLSLLGILITMANPRRSLDKEIIDALRSKFPNHVFRSVIRAGVKVAEASYFQQDLFEYDPKGPAAEAYTDVANEIMERGFNDHAKA